MPNLFGQDIAGIIAREIGPGVLPATLTKVAAGNRNATNPTAGRALTESTFRGRGFIDEYETSKIDGTRIQQGDRRITLIANTFPGQPVPTSGDKIAIENETYTIVSVRRDPAAATYDCQSRGS